MKKIKLAAAGVLIFASGYIIGTKVSESKDISGNLIVHGDEIYLAINSVENIRRKNVIKLKVKRTAE